MDNSKPKKVLFERVFLWSYLPKNAEGVLARFLVSIPVILGLMIIEAIGRVLDYDLSILQFAVAAIGMISIQRYAMRHSSK